MLGALRVNLRVLSIALRRLLVDSRSRKYFGRLLLVLLVLGGYAAYLLFVVVLPLLRTDRSGWQAAAFYAAVFLAGGTVALLIRRSARKDREVYGLSMLHVALPKDAQLSVDSTTLSGYLRERLMQIASLFFRACAEANHNATNEQQGHENTRATLNEDLRNRNLWVGLSAEERELMALPEGAWTGEQVSSVFNYSEQLRLLRWTLCIDKELLPLECLPLPANEVIQGVHKVLDQADKRSELRDAWELRIARDAAAAYLNRVVAECHTRGITTLEGDLAEMAIQMRTEFAGSSTDFLAGSRTVAELPDDDLVRFSMIVSARHSYASYLTDLLSAPVLMSFDEWCSKNLD